MLINPGRTGRVRGNLNEDQPPAPAPQRVSRVADVNGTGNLIWLVGDSSHPQSLGKNPEREAFKKEVANWPESVDKSRDMSSGKWMRRGPGERGVQRSLQPANPISC